MKKQHYIYIGLGGVIALLLLLKCKKKPCNCPSGGGGASSPALPTLSTPGIVPKSTTQTPAVTPPANASVVVQDPVIAPPPSKFRAVINGIEYIYYASGSKYIRYRTDIGSASNEIVSLQDYKTAYSQFSV